MKNFDNFTIDKIITEQPDFNVYSAIDNNSNSRTILKVLNQEYSATQSLFKFKNEIELAKKMRLKGIIKPYSTETFESQSYLVAENIDGIILSEYIKNHTPSVKNILEIAENLSTLIVDVHKKNITIKSINPNNIVINTVSYELTLIDLELASELASETHDFTQLNFSKLDLNYISPELTGRMNRTVDYRTDFYSLGIIFYELLTKRTPFASTEVIEQVHAHIAKTPIAPNKINNLTPQAFANIVMKLLEKNPEMRYQNASILKNDINKCIQYLKNNDEIPEFNIGVNDLSNKFQLSQALYGREQETETLLSAYNKSTLGSKEIVTISGRTGIGKTVLVNEIQKPIVKQNGFYISGKYQQFNRNFPYSGLIQAFSTLIKNILSEGDKSIEKWEQIINKKLGSNCQVIIDVIPELGLITGKQKLLNALDVEETQNRFKLTFIRFIQLFAIKNHPLVIFLDDMQWCDLASMKLIEQLLIDDNTTYLLLITAYRNTEVSEIHPFTIALDELAKNNIPIQAIEIGPLKLTNTFNLIKDSLKISKGNIIELAEIVFSKTRGNPFFINQFITNLYNEGILHIEGEQNIWQWDINKIKEKSYADNMIDFLVEKLNKLNDTEKKILKEASSIGTQFCLKTLALISNNTLENTSENLKSIQQNGLIISLNKTYETSINGNKEYNEFFKFSHDQIQKAAYSIIEDNEKEALHYSIANILFNNFSKEELNNNIFDIIYQFNASLNLIKSNQEKADVAQLFLKAGTRAKNSAAYKNSVEYFTTGLELLGDNKWDTNYELLLKLHIGAAEAAYLTSNFIAMEELTNTIIKKSSNLLDKAIAYRIKIQSAKSENDMPKALNYGLEVMDKVFGISFPKTPKKHHILLALIKLKFSLVGKKVEDFNELPTMTDPKYIAAMDILANMLPPAYVSMPEMLPLITFKQVYLSAKYGNSVESSYIYSVYGLILTAALGDINNGYKYGELAMTVAKKFNNEQYLARTLQVFNVGIKHWKTHADKTIKSFSLAAQYALESGDLEYYGNNIYLQNKYSFLIGKDLKAIDTHISKYIQPLINLHQISTGNYLKAMSYVTRSLITNTQQISINPFEHFNSKKTIDAYTEGKDFLGLFHLYLWEGILSYSLTGDYEKAITNLNEAKKYIEAPQGMLSVPFFFLFESLCRLALLEHSTKPEQKTHLKIIHANQKQLSTWVKHAPMNIEHKFYLVDAELHCFNKNFNKADESYNKAIACSKEQNYINIEGFAHEHYGHFLQNLNQLDDAKTEILKAINCYNQWGAHALVEKLNEKYKSLLFASNKKATITEANNEASNQLDVISLMKASQALSEERDLNELLKKLLKTSIENAGATKGILLLNKNDKLVIEAESSISENKISVLQSIPYKECSNLSQAVVNYVHKTNKHIVLDNATTKGDFTNETYFNEKQINSVLCIPIIYKTKLTGIIYFENNLVSNAFTDHRVEIINLLTSQIAISLENAFFYRYLEDKVQERTIEIQEQKEEILQQKEEISVTAEHLEHVNKELEKLSIVASNTNNAVIIADKNGNIEWVNEAFTHIFGYKLNELTQTIGKNIASTNEYAGIEHKINQCIEQKESVEYIILNTSKTGEKIWIQTSLTPILDKVGDITKIIAIYSNITKLKEAEESIKSQKEEIETQRDKVTNQNTELEEYRNHLEELVETRTKELRIETTRAQESDKLKSAFLANMSHEIRTPLNAIVGYSKLLTIDEVSKENTKHFVDLISSSSDSLIRLINDIMDISVIEAGQLVITKDNCNLNSILDELLSLFHKTIITKNKDIQLDLKKPTIDSEFIVNTDPGRLQQILTNLLENAIKFTEAGSIEFGYSLRNETQLLFYVKDTGIGIEKSKLNVIFNRFLKLEDDNTKLYRGAGIGLSLTQSLVEALDGEIWAESIQGDGSTFYFTIKYRNSKEQLTDIVSINENVPKQTKKYNWGNKTILIAEDEETNFNFLNHTLSSTNINIFWAKDGQEAINIFKKYPIIDIILMDIRMPNINGMEATKTIKSINNDIPIIAQTAYAMQGDKNQFIDAGCSNYLSKPIDPNALIEMLSKYISI